MQEYNNTDQQIHWLCQIIAKANRTYVPEKEDDSHTNLYYDVVGNRIVGRWVEASGTKYLLTLNLRNLSFEWVSEAQQVIQSVGAIGKVAPVIEEELKEGIRKIGLSPNNFSEKLHFDIPDYSFSNSPIPAIGTEELEKWKYYRKLSNEACCQVLDYLQVTGEVRIWPHHFDTGIYVLATKKTGIGFGLAMEDSMAGSAYFYISGYPTSGNLKYENLPDLPEGRWEAGAHWSGAILPLSSLYALSDSETNLAITTFILRAINWFIKQ